MVARLGAEGSIKCLLSAKFSACHLRVARRRALGVSFTVQAGKLQHATVLEALKLVGYAVSIVALINSSSSGALGISWVCIHGSLGHSINSQYSLAGPSYPRIVPRSYPRLVIYLTPHILGLGGVSRGFRHIVAVEQLGVRWK
jgi:hypothetical protein